VNNFLQPFVADLLRNRHFGPAMNTTTSANIFISVPGSDISAKDVFRHRFQRSLRSCVRRGFSVEEAFGMIWEETWEEVILSEREQSELYDELIDWAKKTVFDRKRAVIHNSYSQGAARL
jgi:hypothetical protein